MYMSIETFFTFLKNIIEEEYQTKVVMEEIVEKSSDIDDYDAKFDCYFGTINVKYFDIDTDQLLEDIIIPIDIFSNNLDDIEATTYFIDHYISNLDEYFQRCSFNIYNNLRKAMLYYKNEETEVYKLIDDEDLQKIKNYYKDEKKAFILHMS